MKMPRKPRKNQAAVALATKRWQGKTKAERRAHAMMMVEARRAKKRGEHD